jgi:hypothetical protein
MSRWCSGRPGRADKRATRSKRDTTGADERTAEAPAQDGSAALVGCCGGS